MFYLTYNTHNATHPLSDITGDDWSDDLQLPLTCRHVNEENWWSYPLKWEDSMIVFEFISVFNLFLMSLMWFIFIYLICKSLWAASCLSRTCLTRVLDFCGNMLFCFLLLQKLVVTCWEKQLTAADMTVSPVIYNLNLLFVRHSVRVSVTSLQTDGCFNDTNDMQSQHAETH